MQSAVLRIVGMAKRRVLALAGEEAGGEVLE